LAGSAASAASRACSDEVESPSCSWNQVDMATVHRGLPVWWRELLRHGQALLEQLGKAAERSRHARQFRDRVLVRWIVLKGREIGNVGAIGVAQVLVEHLRGMHQIARSPGGVGAPLGPLDVERREIFPALLTREGASDLPVLLGRHLLIGGLVGLVFPGSSLLIISSVQDGPRPVPGSPATKFLLAA